MKKEQLIKILKPYLKPFNVLLLFLFFGVGLVLLMIFLQQKSLQKKPSDKEEKKSQIEIQDGETLVTINENGMVEFETPDRVFYQKWDDEKIQAIFQHVAEKAKVPGEEGYTVSFTLGEESQTININQDDEIISEILSTVGDLAAGGTEDSIIDYFKFSSPSPTPGDKTEKGDEDSSGGGGESGESGESEESGGGEGEAGSPGGDSGGGSSGGRPPDCPFWVLSMCIWPRPPPPTGDPQPSPSPPPRPSDQPTEVTVPDCTLWDELITRRTVISQTLCIKEE